MSNNTDLKKESEIKPDSNTPSLEGPRYTCTLGGAYGTILAINNAVPILHAGAGCGFANLFGYSYGAGINGVGYIGGCATPSCNMGENEVVFGGEKRLKEQIQGTLDFVKGDLYAVIGGCVPGLIGDDIEAVVKEINADVPLIYTDAAGFTGDSHEGYKRILLSIIDQILPDESTREKGVVNIFGVVPFQNIFWKGDLQEIRRILAKLGLEVNIIFGDPHGGLNALEKIPTAEYNILLSPYAGKEVVDKLKEKYDTPYIVFPYIPSGGKDTAAFLETVAEKLDVPADVLERAIQEEEINFYGDVDNASDFLIFGFPALPFGIVGESNYVTGNLRFLVNELGFVPTKVIITDNPPEEAHSLIEQSLEDLDSPFKVEVVYEQDTYNIKQILNNLQIAVLFASSQEKFWAQETRLVEYLNVSFPSYDRLILRKTYAGYRGGINFLEDLGTLVARPF